MPRRHRWLTHDCIESINEEWGNILRVLIRKSKKHPFGTRLDGSRELADIAANETNLHESGRPTVRSPFLHYSPILPDPPSNPPNQTAWVVWSSWPEQSQHGPRTLLAKLDLLELSYVQQSINQERTCDILRPVFADRHPLRKTILEQDHALH